MVSMLALRRAGGMVALAATMTAQAQTQVATVTPQRSAIRQELTLSGSLSAEQYARLSARVDGLVAQVHVDAGDRVEAGAALLQLDPAMAQLALRSAEAGTAQAQAALREAERRVEEAQRLTRERHLPQTELETREADLALARAALQGAQAAERQQAEILRRHRLPAPFPGVIVRKLSEAGEWVTRGTPVLELASLSRVRLDVQVPQEYYAALSAEAAVSVQPDASPGLSLPGRIAALVPVGDASARTFLMRVALEDERQRLLPGTSATATIRLAAGDGGALLVPRDALLRHPDGGHSLFIVERTGGGAVARRRTVSIGRDGGGEIEILSGLSPGEPVVVRGNEVLRDGEAVRLADGA